MRSSVNWSASADGVFKNKNSSTCANAGGSYNSGAGDVEFSASYYVDTYKDSMGIVPNSLVMIPIIKI